MYNSLKRFRVLFLILKQHYNIIAFWGPLFSFNQLTKGGQLQQQLQWIITRPQFQIMVSYIIITTLIELTLHHYMLKWVEKGSNNQISLLITNKKLHLLVRRILSRNYLWVVKCRTRYAISYKINTHTLFLLVPKHLMMILQQTLTKQTCIQKLMTLLEV